jgi:serine/threonine protein kinase
MKFGQYELLELIATGGMAEVYKGRVAGAEGFEKLVAIKRILPDLGEDQRFVTMLLTEARIHSALSHRNIVQIHDLGISEDGEYFIVLEYVEGYDLRMIMEAIAAEGEIIPEALSLLVAAELAQGLHFAHELRGPDGQPLGIIHRDVSPSNVLISFAGEVKLSDFGLAKRRHDRSVVGSLKGNLSYMSPEQARQAPLDRRSDIFSLGAVLFEMLTGRRLREIEDEVNGWREVASGVVPTARSIRPDLPESFDRLLSQALASEPARRFPDAAAFGSAIREILVQMNTPVGSSDLQALLGLINPPRKPRGRMERSKVIRLAELKRPAPINEPRKRQETPLRASGMTPTPPPPITRPVLSDDDEAAAMPDTPPPVAGAAPIQEGVATPPMVMDLAPPAGSRPTPAAGTRPARPSPASRQPGAPGQGARAQQAPSFAPQRHAPAVFNPGAAMLHTPRPHHETMRIGVRSRGIWRPVAVAVLAVIILAPAAVHFAVIPLDILLIWTRPARLWIASDPDGAAVKLDGAPLTGTTPTNVEIRRDRKDHVIELTLPGFRPARETARYDRSVGLSHHIRLEKDPEAAAAAAAAAAPVPPAAGAADGGTAATATGDAR